MKSILQSVLLYALSVFKILRKFALAIEKIQKIFLWTGMEIKKILPLIAWENVCMPLNKGGLDLRRITSMNEFLLVKLYGGGTKRKGNGRTSGLINTIGITMILIISLILIWNKGDL